MVKKWLQLLEGHSVAAGSGVVDHIYDTKIDIKKRADINGTKKNKDQTVARRL